MIRQLAEAHLVVVCGLVALTIGEIRNIVTLKAVPDRVQGPLGIGSSLCAFSICLKRFLITANL